MSSEKSTEDILKMAQIVDDTGGVLFEHIKENQAQHKEINERIDTVTRETTDTFEAVDNRISEVEQAVSDIELLEPEKGEKGDKGDKGDTGKKGDKGDKGERGDKGDKGDKGEDGVDGINGVNGLNGKEGEKGDKPDHQWNGTKLRFEKPDGGWGKFIDLQGKAGASLFNSYRGGSYTDALARASISETISGIDYNNTTGVFSLASGYVIPTTTEQSNWNTAFSWGNHALAGYLTSETDPIYTASSWFSTTNNASNWDTAFSWGNHASAGYLTTATAASTYVPYTGATSNVTLGAHKLITDTGSNGGVQFGTSTIYELTSGNIYTPYNFRAAGFSYGATPTSQYPLYFSRSDFGSAATGLGLFSFGRRAANSNLATMLALNASIDATTNSVGATFTLFGFLDIAASQSGAITGTVGALNYTGRFSGTSNLTTTAIINATTQFGTASAHTYSNAAYTSLATYLDLSTTTVNTIPSMASYASADSTMGRADITNKYHFWANGASAGGSGTITNHYGLKVENMAYGTNRYAISLEGSGLFNGIWMNNKTVTLYADSTTLRSGNKIRSDVGFNTNGTDGLSATYTFGGGASGEVATMTFSGGILTAVTLVP